MGVPSAEQPAEAAVQRFRDKNPRGFGLLQLDRDFSHYQDIMGWYNKRPSLWVEPRNQWGKGAVNLMEIPTTGETLDNIVCFWQPEKPVKAGDELDFRYRLYWSAQPPVRSPLARVLATRTGMGGFLKAGRRVSITRINGPVVLPLILSAET